MSSEEISGAEKFVQDVTRLLRYAEKPGRDEVYQIAKIVLVSLILVGLVGFLLRLILQALIGG